MSMRTTESRFAKVVRSIVKDRLDKVPTRTSDDAGSSVTVAVTVAVTVSQAPLPKRTSDDVLPVGQRQETHGKGSTSVRDLQLGVQLGVQDGDG